MRMTRLGMTIAVVVLLGLSAENVFSAETEGFHFDEHTEVGGAMLLLNGTGVRAVSIFKGYAAGLYVPERSTDAAMLIAEPGSKRITMRMLLATQAQTFVDAVDGGLKKNYSPDEVGAMSLETGLFDDNMRLIGTVRRGDAVDIDYDALAKGTRLRYNGAYVGVVVPGEKFYTALLRIFIGTKPVDKNLRAGLLGIPVASH